jgi:hypothetical protein
MLSFTLVHLEGLTQPSGAFGYSAGPETDPIGSPCNARNLLLGFKPNPFSYSHMYLSNASDSLLAAGSRAVAAAAATTTAATGAGWSHGVQILR